MIISALLLTDELAHLRMGCGKHKIQQSIHFKHGMIPLFGQEKAAEAWAVEEQKLQDWSVNSPRFLPWDSSLMIWGWVM